jgi:lipopolysaccharide transport system permease protein
MVQEKTEKLMRKIASEAGKENTFKRYVREFFDLTGLVRNLSRHRGLIYTMAWRDFSARYRGSLGGLMWSVIQPLVMMVIYTIVFSLFLKIRFSTDASPANFSVYLLCGFLPWSAFSEAMSHSKDIIRSNINLVKRVVFPLEILPLNASLTASIQQIVGFLLLIPLAWWVTGNLFWTIFFVPIILFFQLLLAIGMNWITASLSVYIPDLGQMLSLILTTWMLLTPIFYPEDIVPPQALILFQINPMARLVKLYRGAFMMGQLPNLESLLTTFLFCAGIFLLGYFWFIHSKKGFSDVL